MSRLQFFKISIEYIVVTVISQKHKTYVIKCVLQLIIITYITKSTGNTSNILAFKNLIFK